MTDYGHDLLFGTFLTPAAGRPGQVVELARRSEQAGLDLVTFQDHPYQPAFLDTWTLMSYVAAATSRIRLATNVLNLPLRQPVVIARSAASLDLLSGGRVELGIGAGGFWDAIEASGGRRLTGAQAVGALAEAIAIIRQVWAAGEPGGVRLQGDHYQVTGAKRGPAPAHDVGIWVGAYKPRMLALTGRLADGWLPSLSYLARGQAELPDMNDRIDDAASAAGRDPAAVRRLLNISGQFTNNGSGVLVGPPGQWAAELAGMALDHGISGFILMADDPATIEMFAAEVVPATRELVSAERATPGAALKSPDDAALASASARPTGFVARPTPEPGVRLAEEHVAIHSVVESLDRALVDHIRDGTDVGDPGDFGPVRDALDLLTDTLLSHLAYEEQQIMEPIARYGFYAGQV